MDARVRFGFISRTQNLIYAAYKWNFVHHERGELDPRTYPCAVAVNLLRHDNTSAITTSTGLADNNNNNNSGEGLSGSSGDLRPRCSKVRAHHCDSSNLPPKHQSHNSNTISSTLLSALNP